MSPRSRYLDSATVLTKPITAISSAASKYRPEPLQMPNSTISAMASTDSVSSARMRSGRLGPRISRATVSTIASPSIARQMGIT
ncbi:hypothetical protein D3C80_1542690 [compost metagenome]